MRTVTKAVIPVAGLGTRVLPASKAIPKEMLPVGDKPVIQHVVEEAIAAGITQIILVTRSGKEAIENHFDAHYELEAELEIKGKIAELASVRNIQPPEVEIVSVRQPRALGLGHAVLCAAGIVGDEPFAVLLPDVLINRKITDRHPADMAGMMQAFAREGTAQIMVEPVPEAHAERYGIVDCGGASLSGGDAHPIRGMVEKPPQGSAPSNLAIVGRYILPAQIMQLLKTTPRGAGGEIQLTDALAALLEQMPIEAYHMHGKSYDCGNKLGYLQANMVWGLQNPQTGNELRAFLERQLAEE
ncbi:UTP--glucose-1-phosphate uridylyltransferase [Marinobacterium nitratireducens]|uniref:UTP--glucose-1-phosphate uridylyltransferase n=1 Tax=Marinobacterium nitratireducens TaxID=518897 RepID=A0A917ZI72_9GAMM|nr:UTP--glucose-1-phosphate uridylyltransferase GalU [Marinobacterium nitratireducens]GGO82609.1 UTP--glucose-1-phosphate uridylyltransferase [Marinobacterium nitratireducens]